MDGGRPMADVGSLRDTSLDVAHLRVALASLHESASRSPLPPQSRAVAVKLQERLAAAQAEDPRFQQVALSPYVKAVVGS